MIKLLLWYASIHIFIHIERNIIFNSYPNRNSGVLENSPQVREGVMLREINPSKKKIKIK